MKKGRTEMTFRRNSIQFKGTRGKKEAFSSHHAPKTQSEAILYRFLPPKRELGTSKIIKILATVVKNQGFAIFSPDRFWTSIWDPPGLVLGGYLAPGNAETSLLGALGPSKSRSKLSFFGSKRLQERSKRRPRAPHTPLEDPLLAYLAFLRAPSASRTLLILRPE